MDISISIRVYRSVIRLQFQGVLDGTLFYILHERTSWSAQKFNKTRK